MYISYIYVCIHVYEKHTHTDAIQYTRFVLEKYCKRSILLYNEFFQLSFVTRLK